MASKKNLHLYKERITKRGYSQLIPELTKELKPGHEKELQKLLLGLGQPGQPVEPDLYSRHGSFQAGQHNLCKGFGTATFTEKRLCKCLYYKNTNHAKKCEACAFHMDRAYIAEDSDYQIEDHEVPAFYYGDGIGEIDLLLCDKDHKEIYATEVKPPKRKVEGDEKVLENPESLLRMVAEIMTYTLGYPKGKYRKAIAFFKGSHQDVEYGKDDQDAQKLKALLTDAKITVFRFEEVGESEYKICKLYGPKS